MSQIDSAVGLWNDEASTSAGRPNSELAGVPGGKYLVCRRVLTARKCDPTETTASPSPDGVRKIAPPKRTRRTMKSSTGKVFAVRLE